MQSCSECVLGGVGRRLLTLAPKHFTLNRLQVHVQILQEALPVCEKEEINSNAHLVKTSGIIGGGGLHISEK